MKEKNQDIADALWKLEEISEDEKLRKIAEVRERWERDELSAQDYWKENGLAEGRKQGLEEGRTQGLEQGLEQGLKQGRREDQIKIARKLLQKGMAIEEIMEITELAQHEIEEMQNE